MAIKIVLVLIAGVLLAVAIDIAGEMAETNKMAGFECEKLRIKNTITDPISVTQQIYNICQGAGVPLGGVTIRTE